jgi:hypothetical protein
LVLRIKELRLRVSEDRVLRRICGPKQEEVSGGWTELHNEELFNLYRLPYIIWDDHIKEDGMRWAEHVAGMHIEECVGNGDLKA